MAIKPVNNTNKTSQQQDIAHQSLEHFLEEEGVITRLRQRITNLESFRELYLKLEAKTSTLDQAALEQQAETISKLERQLQETNGCQTLLESEIERLLTENEILKSNNTPSLPNKPNSIDANSEATIAGLKIEVTQAMNMAFGAMRSNADLGGVIHLLTQSFECSTTEELGKLVLEVVSNYKLTGVIAFSHSGKKEYFSTNPPLTPEQTTLINEIPQDTILTETETYLMFHTNTIEMLISEFDTSNFKAFNDLKDTLSMLVTGANAGARRIISELSVHKERANLIRLINTTQKNIKGIDTKQQKEIAEISTLATELVNDLTNELAQFPGEQDRKKRIINAISEDLNKMKKVVREASFIDENFKKIIDALAHSLSK